MNFKRLLNTDLGRVFISILLGLGLATLFRKVCTDKNCITFNGPVLTEIDGKTFKHGEGCYKYDRAPVKCDASKQIIDIAAPEPNESGIVPAGISALTKPQPTPASSSENAVFGKWFS